MTPSTPENPSFTAQEPFVPERKWSLKALRKPRSTVPAPPGRLVTGHLFEAWEDPIGLIVRGTREYGDLTRLGFGPITYLIANRPEDVRRVLVAETETYGKSFNYEVLKLVLGNGLVTSQGPLWKRQRKMAQPAFHPRRVASFVNVMARAAEDALTRFRDGVTVDVHEHMMALTFRIVGLTLVSTDLERTARAFGESLTHVLKFGSDYSEAVVRVPTWVPTPKNIAFLRHKRFLDETVMQLIQARRLARDKPDDLLTMLMEARDDANQAMSDEQLRDEIMTMVIAGHETTAVALSFALHLLAKHPQVARDVMDEVDAVATNGVSEDNVGHLELTERVVREAVRLYPPAWIMERQARRDAELSSHVVRQGDVVAVCPYTLHRHPEIYRDPEGFDPTRFEKARMAERPRYSYLPFGAGPRVCIGGAFAITEAKIVLATLLREFRFETLSHREIPIEAGITLRPKHGIRMTPRRRHGLPPTRQVSSAA